MTIHAAITRLTDPDLMRRQALIGGAWVEADNGAVVDVTDPATGTVLGTVPDISAAQTRAAIGAADVAFASWRKRTSAERAPASGTKRNGPLGAPKPRRSLSPKRWSLSTKVGVIWPSPPCMGGPRAGNVPWPKRPATAGPTPRSWRP